MFHVSFEMYVYWKKNLNLTERSVFLCAKSVKLTYGEASDTSLSSHVHVAYDLVGVLTL